ncbi:MAG: GNAT family N-acetyltransferase [Pedobacter sp.]|uniref:GNAT family N-acetyltransferase n=1 Tax=Pedobacter sp. TaxID=1411316 RepID=UPI00356948E1
MKTNRIIYSGLEELKPYFLSFNELYDICLDGDYEPWYGMGYWDNTFIPFFIVQDNKVIANVSVSPMVMVLQGQSHSVLQISAVMTHPSFRNQGLSRYLIDHVMDHFQGQFELLYLFANAEVLDFYPKFGFVRLDESRYSLKDLSELEPVNSDWRKLSTQVSGDKKLLERFSKAHRLLSKTLSFEPNPCLTTYHFILQFENSLYYSEKRDCLIIMEFDEEELNIYDVFSDRLYRLEELIPSLVNKQMQEVNFFFVPDTDFGGKLEVEKYPFDDDAFYIYPEHKKDIFMENFVFPITSHY